MPLLDLSEVGDDLATYLGFYVEQAEQAADPAERGAAAGAVCSYYEALGLVELLLDANVEACFHHLVRSAQTRLWLTEQTPLTDETRKALRVSFTRPLFDALAAGQLDLARRVAARETTEWAPRFEYEDDFLYARFLHRYLLADGPEALTPLLERFEAVVEGAPAPRLDLCRVLLDPEPAAAEEAFLRLVEHRTAYLDTLKEESSYWDGGDALLYPTTFVFVEGLAWLRLLERAGLPMADDYLYCPRLARRPFPDTPFDARLFPYRPL